MKKLLFIGLAFVLNCGSIAAQDTLDMLQKTNYYFNPSGCVLDSLRSKLYALTFFGGSQDVCGSEVASYFHTDTALTVYGIVACLQTFPEEPVYDTSYDRSIQHLRLYLPSVEGPKCVRQARIHLHHTPISYYADFHDNFHELNQYIQTYERYFDSAITVTGKFYCGLTYTARQP